MLGECGLRPSRFWPTKTVIIYSGQTTDIEFLADTYTTGSESVCLGSVESAIVGAMVGVSYDSPTKTLTFDDTVSTDSYAVELQGTWTVSSATFDPNTDVVRTLPSATINVELIDASEAIVEAEYKIR